MSTLSSVQPGPAGQTAAIDYKWVAIGETFRPEGLQRSMNEEHVNRIVATWNDAAFGAPILSYREHGNRGPRGEAYAIVAGQHRIEAARRVGKTRVLASVVYGLNAEAEARLFIDENTPKKPSALQQFHLTRRAGIPEYVAIWEALTAAGFVVPAVEGRATKRAGNLSCVQALLTAHRLGVLPGVLAILTAAFDRAPDGCRVEIVQGLTSALRWRGDVLDVHRLARRLAEFGARNFTLRYRAARETGKAGGAGIAGNLIIDIYNWKLRSGLLDLITNSEMSAAASKARTPERLAAGGRKAAETKRAKRMVGRPAPIDMAWAVDALPSSTPAIDRIAASNHAPRPTA